MKICGMEFGEKTIGKIKELIGKGLSRTRLSQEVCRIYGFAKVKEDEIHLLVDRL